MEEIEDYFSKFGIAHVEYAVDAHEEVAFSSKYVV